MQLLNSVLIEGIFIQFTTPENKEENEFLIDTNGAKIRVKVTGKLAELSCSHLYKGRHVRIVGKLINVGKENKVIINAEHIEYMPAKKED